MNATTGRPKLLSSFAIGMLSVFIGFPAIWTGLEFWLLLPDDYVPLAMIVHVLLGSVALAILVLLERSLRAMIWFLFPLVLTLLLYAPIGFFVFSCEFYGDCL